MMIIYQDGENIMVRKIVIISISCMLFVSFFVSTVSGLGMANLNFGDVEQGKTYNNTVVVFQSHLDFDNHFVMEKGGVLADWISISPLEFDLGKSESKDIRVVLKVPKDAKLGEYDGTITAVGQKTVPTEGGEGGTTIGFRVATESKIYANVIKPGAREIVAIEDIVAPGKISPGEIAGFSAVIRNTGNVPTTAVLTLTIQQDSSKIAEVPSAPLDLAVGETKEVELFWKPAAEGNYQAVLTAGYGGKTTNSDPISIAVGGSKLPGMQAFAVIIVILGAAMLFRRRS